MRTSSCGAVTGRLRSSRPWSSVNTVVLAPMPIASVRMVVIAKIGCLSSARTPSRTSARNDSSQTSRSRSRTLSRWMSVVPRRRRASQTRGFGRGAGGDQLVGALGEVERELAIDVVGDLPGAEDVDQAGEPGHRGLLRRYGVSSTRWTPVHSRVQLSSSSASCFRPAWVMV